MTLLSALDSVFNGQNYSNKVIEKLFKENKKLGVRDRQFIAENLYDLVRWWRKVLFCSGLHDSHFAQDRMFSESELTKILLAWLSGSGWQEPEFLDNVDSRFNKIFAEKWNKKSLNPEISHSYSDFFMDKLKENFPDSFDAFASSLNQQASIYILSLIHI